MREPVPCVLHSVQGYGSQREQRNASNWVVMSVWIGGTDAKGHPGHYPNLDRKVSRSRVKEMLHSVLRHC